MEGQMSVKEEEEDTISITSEESGHCTSQRSVIEGFRGSTPFKERETEWSSADDTVRKVILLQGVWGDKPWEGTTCVIKITNIEATGIDLKKLKEHEELSWYFNKSFDGKLVIGESDTEIDRTLEKCLMSMLLTEECRATLKIYPRPKNTKNVSVGGAKKETWLLTCTVEMIKFENCSLLCYWSDTEKLQKANLHKSRGIELFKVDRIIDSFYRFSKAVKLLITTNKIHLEEGLRDEYEVLKLTCYNNMAICHYLQGNYENVVDICKKVLEKEPDNVKALYHRGVAYIELQEYESAKTDLNRVQVLDPNNMAVREKQALLQQKEKQLNTKYATAMKKMFS